MKIGFYSGVRRKKRKSAKKVRAGSVLGRASKACKGLGKRARSKCMKNYFKRAKR